MSRDWPIVFGGTRRATPSSLPTKPVVLHEMKHPVRRPAGVFKRLRWRMVDGVFVLFELGAIGLVLFLAYLAATLPDPGALRTSLGDNASMQAAAATGAVPVRLADLPSLLPQSVMKVEGDSFDQPMRFDLLQLVDAISGEESEQRSDEPVAQRLAAGMLGLQPGRADVADVIRQWMLGARLEHTYTQAQLIEIYLNRASFGAGVIGIDAAARRYFGREPQALSADQSVQLAVLVDLPERRLHVVNGHVTTGYPAGVEAPSARNRNFLAP